MSIQQILIQKGRRMYIFGYMIAPLGYLIKLLVSQSIDVQTFGILYTLIGFSMIVVSYNDLGCTDALQFFFPKLGKANDHNKRIILIIISFGMQVITSIFFLWFLYIWTDDIIYHFITRYSCVLIHDQIASSIKLFGFFILFANISQIVNNILIAMHDTFWQQGLGWIRMVITLLGTILFIRGPRDTILSLQTFVWTWVGGHILTLILGIIVLWQYYKHIFIWKKDIDGRDWQLVKEFGHYAFVSLLGTNTGSVLGQIDQQMVMYFLGPLAAGYMTTYLSIVQIPFLLIGPILGYLYPLTASLWHAKNIDQLTTLMRLMMSYCLVLGCGMAALMNILAYPVVIGLFGNLYHPVIVLIQRGIWIAPLVLIQSIVMSTLGGLGMISERNYILLGAIPIAILLNLFLIHPFGNLGVVMATIGTTISIIIASIIVIHRHVSVNLSWGFIWKNLLLTCFLWGVTMMVVSVQSGRPTNRRLLLGLCIGRGGLWIGAFVVANQSTLRPIIAMISSAQKPLPTISVSE